MHPFFNTFLKHYSLSIGIAILSAISKIKFEEVFSGLKTKA